MRSRTFTPEEVEFLFANQHQPVENLAAYLDRSTESVRQKLVRLELSPFKSKRVGKTKPIKLDSQCFRCEKPRVGKVKTCLLHWAVKAGESCGHSDLYFAQQLLDKLEYQQYKCALTGEHLIPGVNASLDHIIPKSRGGAIDKLENVQWVTTKVNYAKQNLLPEEFIKLCRAVLIGQGRL
jgi:5-methylcytosine-specific restriction endonuclease McrA